MIMRRLSLMFLGAVFCGQLGGCAGFQWPFSFEQSPSATSTRSVASSSLPTHVNLNSSSPKKVFVLLPLQGKYGESGQAVRNGFMAAYYANKGQQGTQPAVKVVDTSSVNITTAYRQAVSEGADLVVGPLDKGQVQSLIKGTSLSVPTLALNTVTAQRVPNLYQFGLSQEDEANQVALRASRDGLHRVLVIAPAGGWGAGIVAHFKTTWAAEGGVIVDQLTYVQSRQLPDQIREILHVAKKSSSASKSKTILTEPVEPLARRRQDIDMIFLVSEPDRAREIVPLLKFYYAENLPIYATSLVYTGKRNPAADGDLNGVHFGDMPWVLGGLSPQLEGIQQNVAELWKTSYAHYPKLYALGVDAYFLALSLNQLPDEGLPGATGKLFVGEDRHIQRGLSWARIRGGVPD